MGLSDVLTDPDSFFEQQAMEPSWLIPIILVLLTSLLAATAVAPAAELDGEVSSMMVEGNETQEVNESVQNVLATGSKILTVGLTFLQTLAGWLLYAVVFYAIAHLGFDGSGSFTDTLALTGWGYVPAVINQAIAVGAAYTVFGGVSLPDSAQAAQDTFTELQSDPILLVSGIIGLAMLAWSGVIWSYAMAKLHDISQRDAAISVGIPVAIVMLLRIWGLV